MTDLAPSPDDTMTPEDVIEFLKENPDFVNEHPEAVELLIPPKKRPRKGEVADFQSYMIERLKEDKEKVMSTTK